LSKYYNLIKPGIVRGNAITAAAGFFLASQGNINWAIFAAAVGGLSLVIASACVFNNYLDRDIDKKMARTKDRALVKKSIKPIHAINYGAILGVSGVFTLAIYTNTLTALTALFGFLTYVFGYTFIKRKSVHGTLVGSVPGAVPPVVGYCSVSDQIDTAAILLFFILVCWQMPHFYSIGIYRAKDYSAAKLPILPLKYGFKSAQRQIVFYIVGFVVTCLLLFAYGYAGYTYAATAVILGILWLRLALRKFNDSNAKQWAGSLFGFSILTLTVLSIAISTTHWLP
jgi:heme o synthase